jgi:hypothetical protein
MLRGNGIYDATCPRDPKVLKERMKEGLFTQLLRRRGSTEARIAILNQKARGPSATERICKPCRGAWLGYPGSQPLDDCPSPRTARSPCNGRLMADAPKTAHSRSKVKPTRCRVLVWPKKGSFSSLSIRNLLKRPKKQRLHIVNTTFEPPLQKSRGFGTGSI